MADKQETTSISVPSLPPGTLTAVESSYQPVLDLNEDEKNAIKALVRLVQLRDLAAYREQVVRVWEKRLFFRGFQHLIPRLEGGWNFPAIGTGYGQNEQDTRSIFETNIYSPYGQIIISALTREFPTPRFEPCDPDNDADITAADAAEKLKFGIERSNDMKALMADMSRLLWTDGQAVFFTRYMKDGQKYGYEDEQEEQEQETVPENAEHEAPIGNDNSNAVASGANGSMAEPESEGLSSQAQPKGGESIVVKGALEFKLPIKCGALCECPYAQGSDEIDVQTARARYPEMAEKIKASAGGVAGDDIDRLARVNVKLGVMDQAITTDTTAYDVTEQITWFRPSALLEIPDQLTRESLMQKSGKEGLRVIYCGDTFCEARSLSMDSQLTLLHAAPGDGMHRPGIGDWLMPIQKVLNNWMELADEYFIRGVPAKWMDNETFSVEKMADQSNMVGSVHPFKYMPGVPVEELIFEETPVVFPQLLWEFIQFFQGELAQLLTGAYDALSGGGDSTPDNVGGTIIQRDQAIGRIGLAWRSIKQGVASMMQQAVICIAKNEEGTIKMLDGSEAIRVDVADLKGNFLAFPETDENFPESPTQKSNRLALVVTESAQNSLYMQLLDSPDNLEIIKNGIGLEDLIIPKLEARDKQAGENVILLKSGPVPNPEIQQLEEQLKTFQAMALEAANAGRQPDPQHVQQGAMLNQQLQQAKQTPFVSSVEIGEFDDDETELATCVKGINSPKGRELKNSNDPDDMAHFHNWVLHAREHQAALAKKKAAAPPVTQKPPSVSMNVKDLPPNVAAEATNAAGLKGTPQDFQAQQVADAAEKHPAGGITG